MKIPNASSPRRQRGGALILIVILFGFGALYLATYLVLTQNESYFVARSQAWNNSMALAEAGVEDAMALINKNVGTFGAITNWPSTAAADGWSVSNNVYSITRWLGTNSTSTNLGYYTVYVTNNIINNNSGPTILSIGYGSWNLSFGAIAAASPSRKVFVQTKRDGLLNANLAAITTIDFNGNNVTLDSFDSGTNYHSDWQTNMTYHGTNFYGTYPTNPAAFSGDPDSTEPYKRKDNAHVATDGLSISDQNANVYGYVNTGPGGTTTVGALGSVGSVSWVPTQGIQPGHSQDDMNTVFGDVTNLTSFPASQNLTKLNGSSQPSFGTTFSFDYVITNTGYYRIDDNPVKGCIYVKATNVFLYLPHGLVYKGNANNSTMYLQTNSDLTIYTGGDIDTSGNSGINNIAQYAPAFAIYGLPTCGNIALAGNGNIVAYVYAPEAYLQMGGNGGAYAGVGAFFVKNIKLNGNMGFHYDEALKLIGPSRAYIPVLWQEVQ